LPKVFDEILKKLVKESIPIIKKTLNFIFNLSLCSGTFPDLMKIAIVQPIQKKEDKKKFPIIDQLQFCQSFKKF
jgi:hypothetical protein